MADEQPRGFPNWTELYEQAPGEKMPWYYSQLDPDLERALAARDLRGGRLLDLGTGPGTQALALAALGFEVTGSDIAPAAVAKARERAAARGLRVEFVQDDILDTKLAGRFDVVFDRGCFHVFPSSSRVRYVETVAALLQPRGLLFLKCFSEEQPGDIGPYQFAPAQIEALFGPRFEVLSIERTVYQGTLDKFPQALFCTLERRP